MAYTSPGIRVQNVFEPLVNPAAGGDRVLAIVGKVITTNMNLYPKKNLELRRTTASTDVVTLTVPDPSLGFVPDVNRVIDVWQGGQYYVPAEYITVTKTASGSGGLDLFTTSYTGASSGVSTWKVYVHAKDTAPVVYDPLITFSGSAPVSGSISWTGATSGYPASGSTYTVVVTNPMTDYAYSVDDTTGGSVNITFDWATSAGPTAGSAYMTQVLSEVPHDATIITSQDEAYQNFGPYLDPTNTVLSNYDINSSTNVNPLSMAAYLAFQENAPSVLLVPYDDISLTLDAALEALQNNDTINIITGIGSDAPGAQAMNDKIAEHAKDASTEAVQNYRLALLNPSANSTFTTAYNNYKTWVQTCDSQRVVLIGPSQYTFKIAIPGTGTVVDLKTDGGWGGVIYGAMMTRGEYDLATAMLRKPSNTIFKIRKDHVWDPKKLDMVAALGVTLFSNSFGLFRVRDDITTSQAGLLMQLEPAITMIADHIAKSAIKVLDSSVIGGKLLVPTTLENVKITLISMLKSKTHDPMLIADYSIPQVTVDTVDTRKLQVVCSVQPIQKVREIRITFSYVASI